MQKQRVQVAILGNGQLAQMLIESAVNLPVDIKVFDLPEIDKNGATEPSEIKRYIELLKNFDVVTYEIENISTDLLNKLSQYTQVLPSIEALLTAQDRLNEKQAFSRLNISTNRYQAIDSLDDFIYVSKTLGFPFIIKTRRFGYDGKGQAIIHNEDQLQRAWQEFKDYALIGEEYVPFDYEVSQIATRDRKGNIAYYPVCRNQHRDRILRQTQILECDQVLQQKTQATIKKLMETFNYIGTLTIEFFVRDGALYANEIAPRVHNSGHWSIDGANCSQFTNHMRAIAGLKVEPVSLTAKHITMINLIGEDVPNTLSSSQHIKPKSYGKSLRPSRKMGHINIVADSKKEFETAYASTFRQLKTR